MAYSPAISPTTDNSMSSSIPFTKERYWLASGSRDKFVNVFDSESNYETVTSMGHHSSTITSVKFNQVHRFTKNELMQDISLITSSADKTLNVN